MVQAEKDICANLLWFARPEVIGNIHGNPTAKSVDVGVKAGVCCLAIWTPKLLDTRSMHKRCLNQQTIFLITDIAERISGRTCFVIFPLSVSVAVKFYCFIFQATL
jgi:hypothetical protein